MKGSHTVYVHLRHFTQSTLVLSCLASLFAPPSGAFPIKLSYVQLTLKLRGWGLLQRLFLL